MKKIRNVLYITSTLIATVIGAGFATGQEVYSFFNVYGKLSFVGLPVVFIILSFVFNIVLSVCRKTHAKNFSEFLCALNLRKASSWIEAVVALFAFCGFCAMASATGSLLSQIFNLEYFSGTILMLFLCAVILLKDIRAIAAVNFILAPIICAGMIYVTVNGILFRSIQTTSISHYYVNYSKILLSAILYASYNILSALSVICSMHQYCDSERCVRISSVLAAGILVSLIALVWVLLELYAGKIELGDMPLLNIIARNGNSQVWIYSIFLFASIFTTALGCGYAALNFLKCRYKMTSFTAVIFLIAASLPICMLGFSEIIRKLYSLFGYIGIPFLIILFYLRIKKDHIEHKKSKKYDK